MGHGVGVVQCYYGGRLRVPETASGLVGWHLLGGGGLSDSDVEGKAHVERVRSLLQVPAGRKELGPEGTLGTYYQSVVGALRLQPK